MRETIDSVVNEREALDAAADGLITRQDAATLLLAHYQSDLFGFGEGLGGNDVWNDPVLIDEVVRARFGAT